MVQKNKKFPSQKGFILASSIILLLFASIAVLGLTTFVTEKLSLNDIKNSQTKAIFNARAGIEGAIAFYRFQDQTGNGYFPIGAINIDSGNSFVLGGPDDDFLMVDTSNAALNPNGRRLRNLRIQNAQNGRNITIDRMIVTWDNARRIRVIRINGRRVWRGNLTSPANCDINNFTLDTTPTNYPINQIRFNGNMNGATISIQFVMTDGSTRDVLAYPASNNFNFTVGSTGRSAGTNIWRTVRADYNALTGNIFGYVQTNTEITP